MENFPSELCKKFMFGPVNVCVLVLSVLSVLFPLESLKALRGLKDLIGFERTF